MQIKASSEVAMDYSDAVAYMDTTIQFGIRPGLERIRALCQELGDPQDSFEAIHIAGTNGKTSTARIASTILSELGLKVGTYTSPHLCSYTERFLISNQPIDEKYFARLLSKIIPLIKEVNRESAEALTHFEILTALAFYLFAQEQLDCAVIETGMGGRWDATNILLPRVAVITNVDLEHTDRLGKTISEIAWEKAHIIKNGCIAITGRLNKEALLVIQKRCADEGVKLSVSSSDFSLVITGRVDMEAQVLSVNGLYGQYDELFVPLVGEHQAENAAVAIAASEAFLGKLMEVGRLRSACRKVISPGRFEVVSRNPLIVLDGAHNPAGVARLAKTLDRLECGRIILVLAILEDKDVDEMLKEIIPHADFTIVAENHSERCMKASSLAQKVAIHTTQFAVQRNLGKALQLAIEKAGKKDLILITGSLYTVGESKEHLGRILPGEGGKNIL